MIFELKGNHQNTMLVIQLEESLVGFNIGGNANSDAAENEAVELRLKPCFQCESSKTYVNKGSNQLTLR